VDNGFNSEFATTVVSNNILLSKRILIYGQKLSIFLTEHIKKIIHNDPYMQNEIKKLIVSNIDRISKYLDEKDKLLLEKDPVSAQQKAAALEQINKRRQDITTSVLDEAREKSLALKERKVLALMGEDWPKGVVGLVAGKLAEEFKKPTFILSKQGLEATGSARGLGEFSVIEALKYSQDLLLRFGGHQQAAGLTLLSENFQAFYEKLSEYAEKNLTTNSEQLTFELEAQVSAIDLSLKFLKEIEKLEPFGLGNPVPKFLVCGLRVKTLKTVGSLNQHLQLVLEAEGKTFKAIAFSKAESFKTLRIGDVLDIATELLVDSWNGVLELKLKVLDVKIHPSTISGV
jgi:single-stranded-DNA-specific exonuclease